MESFFNFETSPQERRRSKYAVVLFLPPALDNIIAPLRERFDPLYNMIPSHITLVYPFETNRSLDELNAAVRAETEGRKPILVELDSIGDSYPDSPVIFWTVRPNPQLSELYYRLYSRLEMPIAQKQFLPHVTVAREISHHRVIIVKEKIVTYLPREKFHASSIDLITPLVNDKWVSVRTFPLSG